MKRWLAPFFGALMIMGFMGLAPQTANAGVSSIEYASGYCEFSCEGGTDGCPEDFEAVSGGGCSGDVMNYSECSHVSGTHCSGMVGDINWNWHAFFGDIVHIRKPDGTTVYQQRDSKMRKLGGE